MLQVEVLETSELGDRSYVAHDGATAIVVDPQRDIDRVEQVLADRGLRCAAVLETHIHNDYVTGGAELSRRVGADYLVSADDPVRFERVPVRDGESREYGALRVTVLHTPGHTDTHLSYLVEDAAGADAGAVFTGGSLLYGSVGRTDLVDPRRTEELTRAQFRSARRLGDLPGEVQVFPTHGFGSFCSSGAASGGESSTVAEERARNDALTTTDEDAFVENLIANLTAYPAYYAHMAPRNLQGPDRWTSARRPPSTPASCASASRRGVGDRPARSHGVRRAAPGRLGRAGAGRAVLDLRRLADALGCAPDADRRDGRAGHHGSAAARPDRDRPARRGRRRVRRRARRGPRALGSYDIARFEDLARLDGPERDRLVVLDTRRDDERREGSVRGSVHIPIHELVDRLGEVPDRPVWVHCATGFRASIAASLLARAGRDVTLLNDDYERAGELGLT